MVPKRMGQNQDGELETVAETARSSTESSTKAEKSGEENISLFWRVFGGTILSIAALVAITLFNNMYTSIGELRAEINREREARQELVKKDEFNTRTASQYERIRSFDGVRADLEGLKEKANSNASAIEGLKRDTAVAVDAVKRETVGLDVLKERMISFEAVKKDIAGLDALKEKFVTAVADIKSAREELNKLHLDIDRNKAADLERKTYRDTQMKQTDETLKELQKGLQDCREKLARLEGLQTSGGSSTVVQPVVRPIVPSTNKPWLGFDPPPTRIDPGEPKGKSGATEPGSTKPGPDDSTSAGDSKSGPSRGDE